MGRLMREKDWSGTSLGSPGSWPQSLRTVISIILNSKFPQFIWWGPDFICFYNDAYRPSLGDQGKHPGILGLPGEQAWPEIWDTIKPQIDRVFLHGDSTWHEDQLIPIYRNGRMEDVYWTYSYSPIYDDALGRAGVLVTCVETTKKVQSLKELETSEYLFHNLLLEADYPTAVFKGQELTLQLANAVTLAIWQKDESIFGKPLLEFLPELSGQPFVHKLHQVYATGQEYVETEAPTLLPRNGTMQQFYFDSRYKALRDSDGQIIGVLVTGFDVTEKVQTRLKLEESLDELAFAVDATELGTWEVDPNTYRFKGNKRLKEWFGLSEYDEIDLEKAVAAMAPADRSRVQEAIARALDHQSGGQYDIEYSITNPKTGQQRIVRAMGRAWFGPDQRAYRFNGTLQDVTAQVLARQKIEQSAREFRQLADSLPELIFTTDADGQQIYASKQWKEFTGLDPKDDASFRAMAHPDDHDRVLSVWSASLKSGDPFRAEVRLKSASGPYEWFLVHGKPIHNEHGEIEKWVGAYTNVHEQKKAEQELLRTLQRMEESEERFRNVADNAPVLIWMADTDRLCYYFNKAWLRFSGKSMDEEAGNGWADGVHPDDYDRCLKIYVEAFDKREEFYMEYRLRRHDGVFRWISDNGVPRFTLDGSFEGYIGACMDIHDQVEYQNRLEENEERLNMVIDASELGIWELDLHTKDIEHSQRYAEIFGHARDAVISHEDVLAQLHPEDLDIRNQALHRALQNGVLQYTARLIKPDGSICWFEAKGKIFYSPSNQPFEILGTIRDITAGKKYEQELQESEAKFRLLADSLPEMIWTADTRGDLNYWNKSVFEFSGMSQEDIVEKGWIDIVHPDDHDENLRLWQHSIETGSDFLFEHRFRRHDGEYRWQLSRATPQKDADGHIQMWVGASTDIQDMKALDEQKDYFISMASHELKTPLTTIKGYVQIMQSMYAGGADDFLMDALKVVDKQVIKLTNLISDLLNLSKIKKGSLALNEEQFDISALMTEIVQEMRGINPEYTIALRSNPAAIIFADRERISQVLINFLTNAVKYSPKAKNITVDSHVNGNAVEVSVHDEGIGISKKDQQKIFERFYRVEGKNEKTYPGFGIGLFIAAEIIRRHHGHIGVKSELGQGATFYFTLPIASN